MMWNILMNLEGPMQSWGISSKFKYRRTYQYPTKSGVIGMICNAMGEFEPGVKLVNRLSTLKMTSYKIKSGVVLDDFQTIGGKYNGLVSTTSDGTPGNKTILIQKYYIYDAKFLVVLNGEKKLINECVGALKNPKAILYLGRKCCLPSNPIYITDCSNSNLKYNLIQNGVEKNKTMCLYDDNNGYDIIKDAPLDLRRNKRKHGFRKVSESLF